MNTVEQTEYKTSGQLPIIFLLLILFAFKYYSGKDDPEPIDEEISEQQDEVTAVATTSTQDFFIHAAHPVE